MWVNKYRLSTLEDRIKILETEIEKLRYSAYAFHPDEDDVLPSYSSGKRMYFSDFYYQMFKPLLEKLGIKWNRIPEKKGYTDVK